MLGLIHIITMIVSAAIAEFVIVLALANEPRKLKFKSFACSNTLLLVVLSPVIYFMGWILQNANWSEVWSIVAPAVFIIVVILAIIGIVMAYNGCLYQVYCELWENKRIQTKIDNLQEVSSARPVRKYIKHPAPKRGIPKKNRN